MLGLLTAIAGPVIGGIMGRSNARYSQRLADTSDGQKLQRMVADAEAAGINPYAALMGGAATPAGPGPRVVSDTAWTNAFDQVENILSGRQAAQDRQLQLQNELTRINIDGARRSAQNISRQPGATSITPTTTSAPRLPSNNIEVQTSVERGNDDDTFNPVWGENLTTDGREDPESIREPRTNETEMVSFIRAPDGRTVPVLEEPEMAIQALPQLGLLDMRAMADPIRQRHTWQETETFVREQMPHATDQEIRDNVEFLMERQEQRLRTRPRIVNE
jgi:hypothetical protein